MAQDANQVNTAAMRSEIERTRAELGHTIDAIHDRLSPRRFMNEAKDTISDATLGRAKRLAHRVTEAVQSGNGAEIRWAVLDKARRNPGTTALIGTAITALAFGLMKRSRRR
jgi:hypothetical protein